MSDRVDAGAKGLFDFAHGYHPELTYDTIHPEHKLYLQRSANAVIEAVDKFDGAAPHVSQRDRGVQQMCLPLLFAEGEEGTDGEPSGGTGG